MPREHSRSARIEARIAPDALAVVKRAAELQGRSISDIVVAAAQEAAHKTIEETQNIRLSIEDQQRFVDLLLNPPPLTPATTLSPRPVLPLDFGIRAVGERGQISIVVFRSAKERPSCAIVVFGSEKGRTFAVRKATLLGPTPVLDVPDSSRCGGTIAPNTIPWADLWLSHSG